jgi:hypothetical protein
MTDDADLTPYDRRLLASPAGAFGRYLVERCYEPGITEAVKTLDGTWAAEPLRRLHARLQELTEDEAAAVLELARNSVVTALHGLMHGLSHDENLIKVNFAGANVADHSDGLHGDLFVFLKMSSRYPYDALDQLELGP